MQEEHRRIYGIRAGCFTGKPYGTEDLSQWAVKSGAFVPKTEPKSIRTYVMEDYANGLLRKQPRNRNEKPNPFYSERMDAE